jgi:hypothetical protein
MMMNQNSNPNLERARKIAEATPAELTAARVAYREYAAANRAIDATPEPFEKYLAEWLDVRKIPLDAGAEPGEYEKRDFSVLYKSGEK